MRMKDSKDVSSYIIRLQTIANQLKHNGQTFTDARIVEKILRSLIKDFKSIVFGIKESRNLEEMTINDLEGSLKAHEQLKQKKKKEVLKEVLQTNITIKEDKMMYVQHNRGRGRGRGGCNYGRSRDHGSGNNNKERGQTNKQNWRG